MTTISQINDGRHFRGGGGNLLLVNRWMDPDPVSAKCGAVRIAEPAKSGSDLLRVYTQERQSGAARYLTT